MIRPTHFTYNKTLILKKKGLHLLKVADHTSQKRQYIATCAFTGDKYLITPDQIYTEVSDADSLFVHAFLGKTLIFSQQCSSVHLYNPDIVQKLPKLRKVRKSNEEK